MSIDVSLVGFASSSGAPVPLLLATDAGQPARLHDFLVGQAQVGNQAAADYLAGRVRVHGYDTLTDYYADAADPVRAAHQLGATEEGAAGGVDWNKAGLLVGLAGLGVALFAGRR